MIHEFNCVRCHGVFETACHSWTADEDGKLKSSWEVLSYRRRMSANLCPNCMAGMGTSNPIFELLSTLEEKKHELERVINDLYSAYEASLDVTPLRQHYLEGVKIWHERADKEIKAGNWWYDFIKDHMSKFQGKIETPTTQSDEVIVGFGIKIG